MKILALDLGKYNSQVCIMNGAGSEPLYRRIATTAPTIHDLLVEEDPDLFVFESSTPAGWIADLAESLEVDYQVANPQDERWNWRRVKVKTDKTDALKLAKLASMGELPTVTVPSRSDRQLKKLIRYRQQLIHRRTRIQNTIRSLFEAEGIPLPRGAKAWSKARRSFFDGYARDLNADLPVESYWQGILQEELKALDALADQVAVVERALDARRKRCESTQRIMTIPGVGQRLAETVVAVIGDPHRFRSSKQVSSYAGLVPYLKESGTMRRLGRVSKRGDRLLRSMLVEVAWISRRYNPHFKAISERYARGCRQRRKKSIVALARRILVICWAMLRDGTDWKAPQKAAA